MLADDTPTPVESGRSLRAVPDLPADDDIDVDQIETYEVWTGRSVGIEGA